MAEVKVTKFKTKKRGDGRNTITCTIDGRECRFEGVSDEFDTDTKKKNFVAKVFKEHQEEKAKLPKLPED